MPLDSINKSTLTDMILWAGINPVPDVVLEQHKQAEIDKHPESWGHKHIRKLRFAAVGLLSICAVTMLLVQQPLIGVCAAFLAMVTVLALDRVRFKGPAKWANVFSSLDAVMLDVSIPIEIRNLAFDAHAILPRGVFLMIGTLKQENKLLDPYLCVTNGAETICLGIWDGDKIIHIATRA